ncbi:MULTISPECIES: hypothetical protein [Methylomonas]|uniref:Uncharacterized protein n=1 Tax=Methylomonas denitrificans TaxID=1538553 RepID=A0A140E6C4_9GAMM|nr:MULTISPECIES: hypothetical protein [Methylomonas]AMK78948.1 hypothetical protein JT25_021080 [Methylomonas denitrificans]OAI01465.1 hypothetical protein A1342_09785 [Methylomonas methanica]
MALCASLIPLPARQLGLIARLGKLARKVKSFATIAKYLVHELNPVGRKPFCLAGESICLARKAFRFSRQLGRLACKVKSFATIAKDRVRELKCFERSVIRRIG